MRSATATVAKEDAARSKMWRREKIRETDESGDFITAPLQGDFTRIRARQNGRPPAQRDSSCTFGAPIGVPAANAIHPGHNISMDLTPEGQHPPGVSAAF